LNPKPPPLRSNSFLKTTLKKKLSKKLKKKRNVNLAVIRVGDTIAEILGGVKEDYYDVIELNKKQRTEDIIRIILEERIAIVKL